jgi:L-amino acid N-acyltransferase YncA
MSKLTEIQKQYRGYIAAKEAGENTKPKTVEVVYKEAENHQHDGVFIYDASENQIEIFPHRCSCRNSVQIDSNDLPALVKALREFIE